MCDCEHSDEPLGIQRKAVQDIQIRSIGYDRSCGRLEIEFTRYQDGSRKLLWLRGTEFVRYAQIFSDLHTTGHIDLATAKNILGISRGVV